MKQSTTIEDFNSLPLYNQLFLALWKREKGYALSKEYTFGQAVELALALTPDLHFDSSAERTSFNNILEYDETLLGWDGDEPLDVLWYELNQRLKKRIQGFLLVSSNDPA